MISNEQQVIDELSQAINECNIQKTLKYIAIVRKIGLQVDLLVDNNQNQYQNINKYKNPLLEQSKQNFAMIAQKEKLFKKNSQNINFGNYDQDYDIHDQRKQFLLSIQSNLDQELPRVFQELLDLSITENECKEILKKIKILKNMMIKFQFLFPKINQDLQQYYKEKNFNDQVRIYVLKVIEKYEILKVIQNNFPKIYQFYLYDNNSDKQKCEYIIQKIQELINLLQQNTDLFPNQNTEFDNVFANGQFNEMILNNIKDQIFQKEERKRKEKEEELERQRKEKEEEERQRKEKEEEEERIRKQQEEELERQRKQQQEELEKQRKEKEEQEERIRQQIIEEQERQRKEQEEELERQRKEQEEELEQQRKEKEEQEERIRQQILEEQERQRKQQEEEQVYFDLIQQQLPEIQDQDLFEEIKTQKCLQRYLDLKDLQQKYQEPVNLYSISQYQLDFMKLLEQKHPELYQESQLKCIKEYIISILDYGKYEELKIIINDNKQQISNYTEEILQCLKFEMTDEQFKQLFVEPKLQVDLEKELKDKFPNLFEDQEANQNIINLIIKDKEKIEKFEQLYEIIFNNDQQISDYNNEIMSQLEGDFDLEEFESEFC